MKKKLIIFPNKEEKTEFKIKSLTTDGEEHGYKHNTQEQRFKHSIQQCILLADYCSKSQVEERQLCMKWISYCSNQWEN